MGVAVTAVAMGARRWATVTEHDWWEQAACRERDCTRHPMRFARATHRSLRSLQLLDERLGLGDDETATPVITRRRPSPHLTPLE